MTTSYTTGAYNRVEVVGDYTYLYDAEGNTVARFIDGNSDGLCDSPQDTSVTRYAWDHRNRLTTASDYADGDDTAATQTVAYAYDFLNRLVGRTVDEDGAGTAESAAGEYYVYDAGQIVLQLDAAGAPTHRYLWAPVVDLLLADETVDNGGAEDVAWPLADHENSIRDLVALDATSGDWEAATHRVFDAYGNLLSQTQNESAADTLFAFTARFYDSATNLQNNTARWYNATTGRWQSEDPIGFDGDLGNLYRYCGNDPINWLDPSGLETVPIEIEDLGSGTSAYGAGGFAAIIYVLPSYVTRRQAAKLGNPFLEGFTARNPSGQIALWEHALGQNLSSSQFIAASKNPLGPFWIDGKLHFIDTDLYRQAGGIIHSNEEIARQIRVINLGSRSQAWLKNQGGPGLDDILNCLKGKEIDAPKGPWTRAIQLVRGGENEVLLEGYVPANSVKSPMYYFTERGLVYGGRVVIVLGATMTAVNVADAYQQSMAKQSAKPIIKEIAVQTGSWSGGIAGSTVGSVLAVVVLGTESGPVILIVGAGLGVAGGLGGAMMGENAVDCVTQFPENPVREVFEAKRVVETITPSAKKSWLFELLDDMKFYLGM